MKSQREQFEYIRNRLGVLGLFNEESLFMADNGETRIIFDHEGNETTSVLFDRIREPLAVFTPGVYAFAFAGKGHALKASCDDMAQMFGYSIPCVTVPGRNGRAFLIKDRGMLVTGRYLKEAEAAVILAEKMCRTEILAEKTGRTVFRLDPLLSFAEHAVYMTGYSRKEKEADHG